MTQRSITHATFCIERRYDAPPARVFAAFADPVQKRAWLHCHEDWQTEVFEMDCRVGGEEHVRVRRPDGVIHQMNGAYRDVVENQRFVLAYEMLVGGDRISVSLMSVEFHPEGGGTRLVFTEQGAFLDGHSDVAEREEGTRAGLEYLARFLAETPVPA